MLESQFTEQVIRLANIYGWRVAHFRPARTAKGWRTAVSGDGKGFGDLFLIKGHRAIGAERKGGRNKPTIEQASWLSCLAAAGIETFVWRPENWDDIVRILSC